jgi:hypothetical protein
MKFLKYLSVGVLAVALVACGGGGGSAGTPSGGSSQSAVTPPTSAASAPVPGSTTAAAPTLSVGLSGGGSSINASGSTVVATVKDASGALVTGKLVTFSGDSTLIKFSPASGQVLTVAGIASIQVSPTSLSSAGAGTLTAKTTVDTSALSTSFDFQLSAANLGLQSLNVGTGSLAAFANRAISVTATINGVAATNTPVQITFNASCGTVTPSVVPTDASGTANTTYTANVAACAGTNVTITAGAAGATSVSGAVSVANSIATNVQFISTTPQLIYLKDSVGTSQAQVVFKVVDSGGNPLQNKKLRLTLSNTATGVSLDTVGNSLPVDLTSDSLGQVSAAVFSGTVPTSLNVKATLLDSANAATGIFSNSNLLTVASGRPTQSSLSLALEKLSIEGMSRDGETTKVTLSMADRQGNPVPPGTQVNFVAESGVLLPAVCFIPPVIPATASSPAIPVSACTVTFRSQGTRTANGRVSILAYVAGEEDFIDANGNNVYDCGETFTDLGWAFRDDNGASITGRNDIFDTGEFSVPRIASASSCASVISALPGGAVFGVPNTQDGVWGAADVRQQATVVFASGAANISTTFQAPIEILPATPPVPPATSGFPASIATPGFNLRISDLNGNSVPTGSLIVVSATDNSPNDPVLGRSSSGAINLGLCTINGISSFTVLNTIGSFSANLALSACTRADLISVTVTTPLGTITSRNFVIP